MFAAAVQHCRDMRDVALSCMPEPGQNRPGREGAMLSLGGLFAATAVTVALGIVPAGAQATYPERPVKIIVPIGPGGSYDLVGRALADALSKRTGQTFVVENKPGAGTVVGTQAAAQSEPDGYTL